MIRIRFRHIHKRAVRIDHREEAAKAPVTDERKLHVEGNSQIALFSFSKQSLSELPSMVQYSIAGSNNSSKASTSTWCNELASDSSPWRGVAFMVRPIRNILKSYTTHSRRLRLMRRSTPTARYVPLRIGMYVRNDVFAWLVKASMIQIGMAANGAAQNLGAERVTVGNTRKGQSTAWHAKPRIPTSRPLRWASVLGWPSCRR